MRSYDGQVTPQTDIRIVEAFGQSTSRHQPHPCRLAVAPAAGAGCATSVRSRSITGKCSACDVAVEHDRIERGRPLQPAEGLGVSVCVSAVSRLCMVLFMIRWTCAAHECHWLSIERDEHAGDKFYFPLFGDVRPLQYGADAATVGCIAGCCVQSTEGSGTLLTHTLVSQQ